jgi:hypothetical protein
MILFVLANDMIKNPGKFLSFSRQEQKNKQINYFNDMLVWEVELGSICIPLKVSK